MRKIYNCFLFCTFILVFSSFAAEETLKSTVTIKAKTSQMSNVIRILQKNNVSLKETAFFFDFDEALATTVGSYQGHEFKFLPCPDRTRTYREAFATAFQKYLYNLETFDLSSLLGCRYSNPAEYNEAYEVLDEDVTDLICTLCEDAGFVGVCSALPGNNSKKKLMKYVGLDTDNYIYANEGKPQAIYKWLEGINQPNKKITAVVLIDNSEEFSISPFLEKMPIFVKDLGLPHLKIIGIEYTKFADMLTQEAIEEELALLQILRNK